MQSKMHSLSMLDIQGQRLGRGGVSAAYIQVESTGVQDAACRLFDRIGDVFVGRRIESGALPGLDPFRPETLAAKVQNQLSAIPALSDPGLNSDEQDACLKVFLELRGCVGGDLGRDIAAHARAVVQQEAELISRGLQAAYGSAPATVHDAVENLKVALNQMRTPDVNDKSLVRWNALKKAQDKFRHRRATLPPSTVKTVQDVIASEIRSLHDQCLRALALTHTLPAWVEEKTKLARFLDELMKRIADLLANVGGVKKSLEMQRITAGQEQYVSRASVVKALPGPTEDQVVAGILVRTRASDEMALARLLLDRFEGQLRDVCRRLCAWIGPDEPLPELLRQISPDLQAEAFSSLVLEAMGPGQSLYEILDREGVQECVEFLFRRSEPTVDLAGRDMPQLGICLEQLCIVTLPSPLGPKDAKLRDDVRAAFEKIEPACTFEDAPSTDQSVTCVRIVLGWPIGLEAQNGSLLNHYQEAQKHGHRPHVFGLLPESPRGQAIDEYQVLNVLYTPVLEDSNDGRPDHQ